MSFLGSHLRILILHNPHFLQNFFLISQILSLNGHFVVRLLLIREMRRSVRLELVLFVVLGKVVARVALLLLERGSQLLLSVGEETHASVLANPLLLKVLAQFVLHLRYLFHRFLNDRCSFDRRLSRQVLNGIFFVNDRFFLFNQFRQLSPDLSCLEFFFLQTNLWLRWIREMILA